MCAIVRAHRGAGESQSLLEQGLLAMHASGQRSASTPRVAAIRLRRYCQKIGADVWASGCTDRAGQNDGDAPALGKRRLEYPSRQYDRIYSPAVGKFVAGATATRAATRARARTPAGADACHRRLAQGSERVPTSPAYEHRNHRGTDKCHLDGSGYAGAAKFRTRYGKRLRRLASAAAYWCPVLRSEANATRR
jgi:hypothetical protein